MTVSTTDDPDLPPVVTFLQFHQPALKDGAYRVTVSHTLAGEKIVSGGKPVAPFTAVRTFTISGERFSLAPQAIHAVFPPDGSVGKHANVLPHIILERSTLPWER